MKHFYLIAAFILFTLPALAAPNINAINNSSWSNNSTWNLGRKPQAGDTVTIPAGRTVSLNTGISLNDIYLDVKGTLRLVNLFSFLSLNGNSQINVAAGGKIEATLDFVQYIFLGGQTIFYENEILGPQYASGSSNGFISYNPLPVKFAGFTVARKNSSDVLVQWSTTEEVNAYMYEVERSFDGSNWNTIAYVSATGNSSSVQNYSYTDKKVTAPVVYYRVRQVDIDLKFSFTDIKSIKTQVANNTSLKISSVHGRILLQVPKEIEGTLVVRLVSLSGQVVDQQVVYNAFGQVLLNTKSQFKGNYIVSVTNGSAIHVARQVIL